MFQRFDKKKTGKIAKADVPGDVWDHFSKMGAVQNGVVTKDSLTAARKKMQERYKKHQPPTQ